MEALYLLQDNEVIYFQGEQIILWLHGRPPLYLFVIVKVNNITLQGPRDHIGLLCLRFCRPEAKLDCIEWDPSRGIRILTSTGRNEKCEQIVVPFGEIIVREESGDFESECNVDR